MELDLLDSRVLPQPFASASASAFPSASEILLDSQSKERPLEEAAFMRIYEVSYFDLSIVAW